MNILHRPLAVLGLTTQNRVIGPFPQHEMLFTVYADTIADEDNRFIQRTLGTISTNYQYTLKQGHNAFELKAADGYLNVLTNCLLNHCVTPVRLTETDIVIPKTDYLRPSRNQHLEVIVGDSVWDWLYYWNHNIIAYPFARHVVDRFCVPPTALNSETQQQRLGELLKRKCSYSGSLPDIVFSSAIYQDKELKPFYDKVTAGVHGRPLFNAIIENQFVDFQTQPDYDLFNKISRHGTIYGDRGRIGNMRPAFLPPGQTQLDWMLDLGFYDSEAGKPVCYPKRNAVARMFCHDLPARINFDNGISLLTCDMRQVVDLRLPEETAIVRRAITGKDHRFAGNDIRVEGFEKCLRFNNFISDKGKYAQGTIKLFPELKDCFWFFQHHFWRTFLEGLIPAISARHESAVAAVSSILTQAAGQPRWQAIANGNATEIKSLAESAVSNVLLPKEPRITFDKKKLLGAYDKEIKEWNSSVPHAAVNKKGRDRYEEIKNALKGLVSWGVFQQGSELTCNWCGSTYWYGISEFGNDMPCKGCRSEVGIAPEQGWVYKVNDLMMHAIRDYGVFAELLILGELDDLAKSSFLYTNNMDIYHPDDEKENFCEIDFACIADGKLTVGEVKTSAEGFNLQKMGKFLEYCRAILPDRIVLGAVRDNSGVLVNIKSRVEALLQGSEIEVLAITLSKQHLEPDIRLF